MEDRLSDGCDAGQDEVDAGQELLAVVVPGQLRRHLTHEWVLRGVELRPLCGAPFGLIDFLTGALEGLHEGAAQS